ncbi:LADA_0A09098g1_1 [Lachancea dasiensis]|uniref:LADA_0A09098g1_1 n=1 Tax=Lachancea dasiensis TaxID=1072105 RepID=A0A1G4IQF0_9SACH|nr:LADA_0A09098g1_1 [Lachancea dasiensis]
MSFEESKSEVKSELSVPVTPYRWHSNIYLLWGLRIGQFVFTIITLGLSAKVLDFGINHATTGYAVAISVMTFVYLAIVTVIPLRLSDCVLAILISEVILAILWFAAFVALAALHGGINCSNRYVYSSGWLEYCRAGQASIAMAFFAFWLFDITATLFWLNVMAPIRLATGGKLFYSGSEATLTRWCNLRISSTNPHTDVEALPPTDLEIVPPTNEANLPPADVEPPANAVVGASEPTDVQYPPRAERPIASTAQY